MIRYTRTPAQRAADDWQRHVDQVAYALNDIRLSLVWLKQLDKPAPARLIARQARLIAKHEKLLAENPNMPASTPEQRYSETQSAESEQHHV